MWRAECVCSGKKGSSSPPPFITGCHHWVASAKLGREEWRQYTAAAARLPSRGDLQSQQAIIAHSSLKRGGRDEARRESVWESDAKQACRHKWHPPCLSACPAGLLPANLSEHLRFLPEARGRLPGLSNAESHVLEFVYAGGIGRWAERKFVFRAGDVGLPRVSYSSDQARAIGSGGRAVHV